MIQKREYTTTRFKSERIDNHVGALVGDIDPPFIIISGHMICIKISVLFTYTYELRTLMAY